MSNVDCLKMSWKGIKGLSMYLEGFE